MNTSDIQKKGIFLGAGVLFLLVILFITLSFKSSTSKVPTNNQQSGQNGNQQANNNLNNGNQGPLSPTPTYVPPPDMKFYTVDSVNFIPHKINDFEVDQVNLQKTARKVFPAQDGKLLQNSINKTLFSWLALNEFYKQQDPSKMSGLYNEKKIEDMNVISREATSMQQSYNKDVLQMTGLYLKVRFS
jgi:hypothetical protein